MTTAAIAPHAASRACYATGCRHTECCEANRRYLKRYRLNRARKGPVRTDAAPIAAHIRALSAAGWSHRQIAAAAHCSRRQISAVINGDYPTIDSGLATRLIAATPAIQACPPTTYVDATGAIRRTQALMAAGYSLAWIAEHADMSPGALGRIVNHGHDRITARRAQSLADVYALWKDQPGTNARARLRGTANGWLTPDFWDDIDRIDDPDFDPAAVTGDTPKYMRLGEDALWLREQGFNRQQVADRLGESVDYIDHSIKRYRGALAEQAEQAEGDDEQAAA